MSSKTIKLLASILSLSGLVSACGDDSLPHKNAVKALDVVTKSSTSPIQKSITTPQSMTLSTQDRVSAN